MTLLVLCVGCGAINSIDPTINPPVDPPIITATPTNISIAMSGGWRAHTAHSGWTIALLSGEHHKLESAFANVHTFSSNSGGSWFTSILAFSMYIHDNTLTSLYDFPCDSSYLVYVDSIEHIFELLSTEKEDIVFAEIYPNPFNNEITVELSINFGNCQIILYDVHGKEINRWENVQNQLTISTEQLNKGLYMLKCSNNTLSRNYKIVKQ